MCPTNQLLAERFLHINIAAFEATRVGVAPAVRGHSAAPQAHQADTAVAVPRATPTEPREEQVVLIENEAEEAVPDPAAKVPQLQVPDGRELLSTHQEPPRREPHAQRVRLGPGPELPRRPGSISQKPQEQRAAGSAETLGLPGEAQLPGGRAVAVSSAGSWAEPGQAQRAGLRGFGYAQVQQQPQEEPRDLRPGRAEGATTQKETQD